MKPTRKRRTGRLAGCLAAAAVVAPAPAHADPFGRPAFPPLPDSVSLGAAVLVLLIAAAALLMPAGRSGRVQRRLPLAHLPVLWRDVTSLLAFVFLATLVAAGLLGSTDATRNPLLPTLWLLFLIILPVLHGLTGNFWSWINPWYGPLRLILALAPRELRRWRLRLPRRLGYLPALAILVCFGGLGVARSLPANPADWAELLALYWLLTVVAMVVFGYEEWMRRGEPLTVLLRFASLVGVFAATREPGGLRLTLCPPAAKLRDVPPLPVSGVLLVTLAAALIAFNGLSQSSAWLALTPAATTSFPLAELGLAGTLSAILLLLYLPAASGQALSNPPRPIRQAVGMLAWSLVPIALAYHAAHYLPGLLLDGPDLLATLSDPLGLGWNIFGAARTGGPGQAVDGPPAWPLWILQAGLVVAGHAVAALLARPGAPGAATGTGLATAPIMLALAAFSLAGLWLLATPLPA